MSKRGREDSGFMTQEEWEEKKMQRLIQMDAERCERWWRSNWHLPVYAVLLGWMAWTVVTRSEAQEVPVAAPVAVPGVSPVPAEERTGADGSAAKEAATGVFPPSIESMREKGAHVVALGEAEGLEGFLVRQPGGGTYAAYVTESDAVVVGLLYGADGEVVTQRQLEEAKAAGRLEGVAPPAPVREGRPEAEGTPADRVAGLLEATVEAPGFRMGTRGPVIHTFVDATCPFSVRHVRALKRDAEAGRLQARVIPVGILGERAAMRAVEVAGAANPQLEWELNRRARIDRDVGAARVAVNNALLEAWMVTSVPFTVWDGPQGVRVYSGVGEASVYAAEVVGG